MKKAVKTAKKAAPKVAKAAKAASPGKEIDAKIAELGDWRGETLAHLRAIILSADAQIIETVKWGGVPVWEQGGIITTGETYKDKVKLTFARGAALKDPAKLFNAADTGATRRAIDIREGDALNEKAFQGLVKAAVALNTAKVSAKKKAKRG